MLRVGIDGRAFDSPAAGIRRYVTGLTRALLALGEPLEVVALGGRDSGAIPGGVGQVAEPPHPPTNLGWTLVGLPRAAAGAGVHLVHAPAYTAPWWSPVPVVVTVHDVSYELHPEWYPYRRDWLRRAFYRRSARTAAHVLTVSRFSASEIASAYRIPLDRISVTPLGVDDVFAAGDGEVSAELPSGVVPPYVLHVGDLHERRNLAMLLEAVLTVRRAGTLGKLSLVLAGVDRGVADGLRDLAARHGIPEALVQPGRVREKDLRALYSQAVALTYPSLYEGFGLPLLEAMRGGVPVIAANTASIPDVVGPAALLLDPRDVEGWAKAIVEVATDEHTRARMCAAGVARAAEFTWERTARLTLDVYRRVA